MVLLLGSSLAAQEPESTSKENGEIARVAGQVEGMTEQVQAIQAEVDKAKKFKWSGYIQVRYEAGEADRDTVRVAGAPPTFTSSNLERFFIRRGRLKMTYDTGELSQAVIYLDGGTDRAIRLLEAYVSLSDPWTPLHQHQLTIGQFNVPFGYEIERSSSVRELPERSRAENVLFPGERDRGAKITSRWTPRFETVVAVMNGGGVNHPEFPNTDPTRGKDLVGRARWSQGLFDVAISGYAGKNTTPLTGPDVETDKTRLGFDAQTFYELGGVGGGSLRGEIYAGTDVNPDSVRALVTTPGSSNPNRLLRAGAVPDHLATNFLGWYLMWVQNIGERFQVAARYDTYDRNTDIDHDQFERLNLGANYFFDGNTRFTIAYDIPTTDVSAGAGRFTDPHDNSWTLQAQHKF